MNTENQRPEDMGNYLMGNIIDRWREKKVVREHRIILGDKVCTDDPKDHEFCKNNSNNLKDEKEYDAHTHLACPGLLQKIMGNLDVTTLEREREEIEEKQRMGLNPR